MDVISAVCARTLASISQCLTLEKFVGNSIPSFYEGRKLLRKNPMKDAVNRERLWEGNIELDEEAHQSQGSRIGAIIGG